MAETQRRERIYSSACETVSIRVCVYVWRTGKKKKKKKKRGMNGWVGRKLLNTSQIVPVTIFFTLLSNTSTFSDVYISLVAV